jgi:hypothetical protein
LLRFDAEDSVETNESGDFVGWGRRRNTLELRDLGSRPGFIFIAMILRQGVTRSATSCAPPWNASRIVIRLALAAAIAAATGCVPKRAAATPAPPAPLPEGKSSYSYIFDPANPALGLPEDVQFVRPLAVETKTLPKYPESALAAHDGVHREIVRIVIDVMGEVGQVVDSPMGRSDGGPFAADYRRTVEAAVRTWRFQPGLFRHVKDGEDKDGDGKPDYKIMTSQERVAVYYDIRFTFEIVDGKGVVKTAP